MTVFIVEQAKAIQLEEEKKAPAAADKAPPKPKKPKRKSKKAPQYAIFGEGDLTFSFTDWLSGSAHVIIDRKGHLTVIGKITPQAEYEFLKQKDYTLPLFKFEPRARYGIPVVGSIFIFGSIEADLFSKIGPGNFTISLFRGLIQPIPRNARISACRVPSIFLLPPGCAYVVNWEPDWRFWRMISKPAPVSTRLPRLKPMRRPRGHCYREN